MSLQFFLKKKQQETFTFEQKCIQNVNGLLRKMWIWEKSTEMVEETVGDKFGETNHENTHIDSCIRHCCRIELSYTIWKMHEIQFVN